MWDLEILKRINNPNAELNGSCKQCGDCCRKVGRMFWYDHSVYTKEQKKLLVSKRNKAKSGCEMLYRNKCRVHILLGVEKTPIYCRQYCCEKEGGTSDKR